MRITRRAITATEGTTLRAEIVAVTNRVGAADDGSDLIEPVFGEICQKGLTGLTRCYKVHSSNRY